MTEQDKQAVQCFPADNTVGLLVLLSNFTAVTEHLRSGPRKQSLSGRQLPPSGESHPAQRKGMQQDANKVPQQIIHPKYSMYYSLILRCGSKPGLSSRGFPKTCL